MNTLGWLAAGAVGLVFVLWVVFKSFHIVEQDTVYVVTRWGKHHDIDEAGLRYLLIIADKKYRKFSKKRVTRTLRLEGDSGGKIPVSMVIELEISSTIDPVEIRKIAYSIERPEEHLDVVATATIRQLLLTRSYEEVRQNSDQLVEEFTKALTPVAAECGFTLHKARITKIRPHEMVDGQIIKAAAEQEQRKTETANTVHANELKLKAAKTEAEALAVKADAERERLDKQAKQISTLRRELVESGLTEGEAASLIETIVNGQVMEAAASSGKAQFMIVQPQLAKRGNIPFIPEG